MCHQETLMSVEIIGVTKKIGWSKRQHTHTPTHSTQSATQHTHIARNRRHNRHTHTTHYWHSSSPFLCRRGKSVNGVADISHTSLIWASIHLRKQYMYRPVTRCHPPSMCSRIQTKNTYLYRYLYVCMCVCVCIGVWVRDRDQMNNLSTYTNTDTHICCVCLCVYMCANSNI